VYLYKLLNIIKIKIMATAKNINGSEVKELKAKLSALEKNLITYAKTFLSGDYIIGASPVNGPGDMAFKQPAISTRTNSRARLRAPNQVAIDIYGENFSSNSYVDFNAYKYDFIGPTISPINIRSVKTDNAGKFILTDAIVFIYTFSGNWELSYISIDAIDRKTRKTANTITHYPPYLGPVA
jgi:hypothetical protein